MSAGSARFSPEDLAKKGYVVNPNGFARQEGANEAAGSRRLACAGQKGIQTREAGSKREIGAVFPRIFALASAGDELAGANKLERAYAEHLEHRKRAGEIISWQYEAIQFRIGKSCFYHPDFLVVLANREVEIHETKGFWRDDARVKIRAAAARYPFRFVGVQKAKGGGWIFEQF